MPRTTQQIAAFLTAVRAELDALVSLGELPPRVFSPLEGKIPPSKMTNLCRGAGVTLGAGEDVLLLIDHTTFGSAKKGWALTTDRLLASVPPARGDIGLTALDTVACAPETDDGGGALHVAAGDTRWDIPLSPERVVIGALLARAWAGPSDADSQGASR